MSNVTQFFSELTSNQPVLTAACLTFASVTSLAIPVFMYAIIWYERYGSDKKRTLLNKLASLACWAAIEYYLVAQTLEIVIFLFAPLPAQFCLFTRIVRSSVFIEVLIFFDLITLTRYFYIFWLKNPAGFHDEFWANFFHFWVKMVSVIFMSTFHIVSLHQSLNYYICSGLDPTTAILNPPRYDFQLFKLVVS